MRLKYLFLFVLSFAAFHLRAQFYNGSQQEFGQNRVQYNGFQWQSHNYERFKVYFNSGSKDYAVFVARAAQKNLLEIEKQFEYTIDEKVEFLVYNTQSGYRQSNLGITTDPQTNIGGTTKIVGSKIFIYYEGDHKKLEQQIRAGIANVLLYQMMYGGNWRDVLKNSTLMSMPKWFSEGFISYVANPWDVEIENRVKDGVLTGKFTRFNDLEGDDAKYVGHAIWNYIAEIKGENVIPNVLYMSRISRNVENGFLYTLGYPLRDLSKEYIAYYKQKFERDEKNQQQIKLEALPVKTKKTRNYAQFKVSPSGKYAAFTSHELGQYKVWLYDINKKTIKRIDKGEHKLNRLEDRSFPVIVWHPTGDGLSYVVEKKGQLYMKIYNIDTKKKTTRELGKLEKVLDYAYSPDGKTIIMSGVYLGQTDLYLFKPLGGGFDQLTNDIYDDLHPEFVNKGRSIIFASNRRNDTLGRKTEFKPFFTDTDIFMMDIQGKKRVLTRVTNTPFINETQPAQYDTSAYTYLSDESGVINRVVASRDSAISHIDTMVHYRYFLHTQNKTNYNRNILEYDINYKRGRYSLLVYQNGKYNFYVAKTGDEKNVDLGFVPLTQYRMVQNRLNEMKYAPALDSTKIKNERKVKIIDRKEKSDTGKVNISDYIFGNDKPVYEKEKVVLNENKNTTTVKINGKDSIIVKQPQEIPFELPDQELYKINFATDYVVTQLNNDLLNASYQRYNGPGTYYYNPGLNGLIKMGLSDVFEDYRIIGGFRYSGDFTSNEHMLMFEDLSRRFDKRIILYRQSYQTLDDNFNLSRVQAYEAKYVTKYAFSEVMAVRGTVNYRFDKVTQLATDYNALSSEDDFHHLAGAKLEWIFDNTIPKGLNLFNGLRAKFFFEYYKNILEDNTNMFVTGIDVRHYQKIHRNIILANRLAASASFGQEKLLYYLGGVDNWLYRDRFDPTIQVAQDQNYAYQAIATPLRGFRQNARNGSNFALINTELRVPLIRYLMNRPLKSDFLENFQVVGFHDIGTAWTGWNPYSENNSFNQTIISSPGNPITVILENQREPIIRGYGWGLRSRLFGYFIRFDWSWGIDDGVRLPPRRYLSLSLDF